MPNHVVIIGNGITGSTTARFLRKNDPEARISIVSSETDYLYSRTALMYIYMGHMTFEDTKPYEDSFWVKNRIDLVRGHVTEIDTEKRSLLLGNGHTMRYDNLVLATGSKSNKFGWPGQDLDGVQGLYGIQDLELMEQNTRDVASAVVVGGGLIGIEMAEMLHSRHIPTTFLVRENGYMDYLIPSQESKMVGREIVRNGIDLRLGTELKEILADESGRVRAIVTNSGETIETDFVGLTAGVSPNTAVVKNTPIETQRGILISHRFETSVPGVYAAGDCAQFRDPLPGQRPLEQLWYTGKMHGEVLGQILAGNDDISYEKGVFFNSAKFFDIEYQTYGEIPAKPGPETESLFWEHPDGNRSIRINYDRNSEAVTGFNLMGIRYRHDVCAGWIRSGTPIESVLSKLLAANFDPEFFTTYERELVAQYTHQHPEKHVVPARKGWYRDIFLSA